MEISVRQMYDIENAGHAMGFHKQYMMENAGAAAVRRLIERIPDMSAKRMLVMAGPGNNGGDGLVMARHMAGYGTRVEVVMPSGAHAIKTGECRGNHSILQRMNSVMLADSPGAPAYDVIVDALLGTGITGDIREPLASAISYINDSGAFVFAVDTPSGLDPDTGRTANTYVTANMTVTFHRMKRGLPKRPDITGDIYAERIGIPPEAEEGIL